MPHKLLQLLREQIQQTRRKQRLGDSRTRELRPHHFPRVMRCHVVQERLQKCLYVERDLRDEPEVAEILDERPFKEYFAAFGRDEVERAVLFQLHQMKIKMLTAVSPNLMVRSNPSWRPPINSVPSSPKIEI